VSDSARLRARAEAWLAQDPDPRTRAELAELLEGADAGEQARVDELAARFNGRLAFGTAGLRGELGAGSNRMNRVLVAQAAAGFAAFLRARAGKHASSVPGTQVSLEAAWPVDAERVASIVIGYDGRRNSDVFARDSAEILAGAGLRVILLPRLLPTPVLAFAVRHFGADAGIMVTASHNPPNDNGYKVYLGGPDQGAQIVSPADAEIAAHIQRVADTIPVSRIRRSLGYLTAGEEVIDAYVAATAAVAPAPVGASALTWVYTAMHGVGWETFARVLKAAGYSEPIVVRQQRDPDGAFPTVAFPNPEEPGAMDLAFAAARAAGADLIIAHDPDADRLAVAIPHAAASEGYRRLTGNEVGMLLGWRAARLASGLARQAWDDEGGHATAAELDADEAQADAPRPALACSLVSSPGLRVIAEHHGLAFHETLTGFKWISRAPGIVFGFEEALGYLVNPETVRDKDGISAAVAMLHLAARAAGRGQTLADALESLSDTFGHFVSEQISIRVSEVSIIAGIMSGLRASMPERFGDATVRSADDLASGVDGMPPSDVLRFELEGDARVIVRPSGTEPKLKAYLDVRGSSADDAATRLRALSGAVRAVLAEHS
jgi:phosphomannomutase